MIGVDHFKAIIDEFDHSIGDKVLIELAKVIHTNISEFDMVARLSGDEFLVSLLSTNNLNDVINICQKIIQDFSELKVAVNENGQTLQKTICIGLDKYEQEIKNSSIDNTIKNADIGMYEAKNKGRSQFFNFKDLKDEDSIELF